MRLPGDAVGGDSLTWQSREESWTSFWRTRGKETLNRTGRATVNGECVTVCFLLAEKYVEAFWVDLVIHNPFNTEVNLSELTVIATGLSSGSEWRPELVDVEALDEIILDPKETRTVNIVVLFNYLAQADILHLRYQCQFWQDGQ